MPREKRNGTITQYSVKVTNKTSGEVLQNVNVSADNVTVVIHNLSMYVTYAFQVQAFTKEGSGPFSQPPVNGTTNQTGMAALQRLLEGYFNFESLARHVSISVL